MGQAGKPSPQVPGFWFILTYSSSHTFLWGCQGQPGTKSRFSFLKNNFIYVCMFGCAGSSLLHRLFSSCSKQRLLSSCGSASHCRGFSWFRVRASVVVALGLRTCCSQALEHRVSRSTACGIFPDQGSNPRLLPWQADSLPLSHLGSPRFCFLCQIHLIGASHLRHCVQEDSEAKLGLRGECAGNGCLSSLSSSRDGMEWQFQAAKLPPTCQALGRYRAQK